MMVDTAQCQNWNIWKRDVGTPSETIEVHYPELIDQDPIIGTCINQIRALELAIDARMQQLSDEADDAEDWLQENATDDAD